MHMTESLGFLSCFTCIISGLSLLLSVALLLVFPIQLILLFSYYSTTSTVIIGSRTNIFQHA